MQALYDEGEIIMDQVLVCLHGDDHRKRRKVENKVGTIEKGMLADILVVDGDPLKDITVLGDKTKLSHIFLNGKEIKREEEIKDITPPQGWRLSPYSDGILTQELAKK